MIGALIGRILRKPAIRDRIIEIAKRTPEMHIVGDDGTVYMYRFWLFNPIANQKRKYPFIPFSIRVHGIMRADQDRHPHDHPWPARTWIMDGWYFEQRLEVRPDLIDENWTELVDVHYRRIPGDTATLGVRQYHRIISVAPGGAWTLFVFGRYREQWGFLVDGHKIGFRQYALRKQCQAIAYGDSTMCHTCGLAWDTNDPARPNCDPDRQTVKGM
jgi:hypothetical protein